MSTSSENTSKWVIDKNTDKEKLKQLAINLEQELKIVSTKSAQMQDFSSYEPLLSAISRAKKMEISVPEVIPGMHHWRFETDMRLFLSYMPSLSEFEFALECWRRKE